jgi:hypothetical protein
VSVQVDVLAVMERAAREAVPLAFALDVDNARAAVAELIECSRVTVKAFEALGRTDGIVAQLESHRECERALVEQKAALARVGGAK